MSRSTARSRSWSGVRTPSDRLVWQWRSMFMEIVYMIILEIVPAIAGTIIEP
jgi:hypothetical protein